MGMLVKGAGETFNLIVPARRIRSWAKKADIEWAIDDKVALPSEEDLKKIPIEDSNLGYLISSPKLILPGPSPSDNAKLIPSVKHSSFTEQETQRINFMIK